MDYPTRIFIEMSDLFDKITDIAEELWIARTFTGTYEYEVKFIRTNNLLNRDGE